MCYFGRMCGRFNVIDDPLTQLLIDITGQHEGWTLKTEYNIAPTQNVPVLVYYEDAESWGLRLMRWWLTPSWSDGPSTRYSMFNAKSETLGQNLAYREPFKNRRCVIPASGYYEWRKEGSNKLPYYMTPDYENGFAFAGLWDCWQGENQIIESCTIVTAAAPVSMQTIHHRIPVHLTAEQSRNWMSNRTQMSVLEEILKPEIRTDIRVTPVSTVVNSARNKDARCLEPLGESFTIK